MKNLHLFIQFCWAQIRHLVIAGQNSVALSDIRSKFVSSKARSTTACKPARV